jgi:hypothetical protein
MFHTAEFDFKNILYLIGGAIYLIYNLYSTSKKGQKKMPREFVENEEKLETVKVKKKKKIIALENQTTPTRLTKQGQVQYKSIQMKKSKFEPTEIESENEAHILDGFELNEEEFKKAFVVSEIIKRPTY